ncbi:MAG: gamma-butyrobetaine hydroxylase-like domain-containing protein [Rhodoferax sp.]
MAGLTADTPTPESLVVHGASRVLEIAFDDGARFALPFEFLRVYSPSAEVQGHGAGQEVLQTGKRDVLIEAIDPVGHYGVQPRFSDGHDTGIYTWDYLYHLGSQQQALWQAYLERLRAAALDRDAPMPGKAVGACGKH